MRLFLCGLLLFLAPVAALAGGKKKPAPAAIAAEDDYYPMLRFNLPPGQVLEGGALEMLPDGKVAFGTRRGEIWLIDHAFDPDPSKAKFTRFAHGLHEVLGLAWKDGWLYVTQRCDVSRIKDSKGTGKADVFEVFNDEWEINGDYHEYAFGSRFDKNGDMWVVLCLTGSFDSKNKYRGWCLRINKDGKMIPTCSGVRSPGGIGMNAEGDVFYTDNQGPWNGTCHLKHLSPGGFVGHPDGNKWWAEAKKIVPDFPEPPRPATNSRILTESRKHPLLIPPVVSFPYGKMGQSASGVDCDLTGGKFGPFQKQLFVGDQTHSTIMRVFLEKVNGRYQGACFPFRQGCASGIVPVRFAPDGSLFAGGTNRGWGSRGTKPFSLDRIVWSGKTPFEIHEMRAKPDGFELTFTQPVDPTTAGDPASYVLTSYTYIYRADYGSPEVDKATPKITKATVAGDNRSVRLRVEWLEPGHIHELHATGVRSADGAPLLHKEAYYTLNQIPTK